MRGGTHEVLEGTWKPTRLVLFRFPDRAAIHAFMDDPGYAPLNVAPRASSRFPWTGCSYGPSLRPHHP